MYVAEMGRTQETAGLRSLAMQQGWVFPSARSACGHLRSIDRLFRQARTEAGLPVSKYRSCKSKGCPAPQQLKPRAVRAEAGLSSEPACRSQAAHSTHTSCVDCRRPRCASRSCVRLCNSFFSRYALSLRTAHQFSRTLVLRCAGLVVGKQVTSERVEKKS